MTWFADWYNGVKIIGKQGEAAAASAYDALFPYRDAASPGVDDPQLWTAPPSPPVAAATKTWDETPWYSKAWTYATSILPGAAADTAGVSQRPGAVTVGDTVSSAIDSAKNAVTSTPFILIIVGVIAVAFLGIIIAVKR